MLIPSQAVPSGSHIPQQRVNETELPDELEAPLVDATTEENVFV